MSSNTLFKRVDEIHFEVTKYCNLQCSYCYMGKDEGADEKIIDIKTIEAFMKTICSHTLIKDLTIILYGGEIFTLPVNVLRMFIEVILNIAKEYKKKVSLGMQSNLTLMNDEYFHLLKEYEVIVGASLDGITEETNINRGHFKKTWDNILRLRDSKLLGGVICVIARNNYQNISSYLDKLAENGIQQFSHSIRRAVGSSLEKDILKHHEIFEAEKQIVQHKLQYGKEGVYDREIICKIQRYFESDKQQELENGYSCFDPFCGAGLRLITCDYAGTIFPCGCSTSHSSFSLGTLVTLNHEEYVSKVTEFHKKNEKYLKNCQNCPANSTCFFGCPAFDRIDPETTNEICLSNKLLFNYFRENESLLEAYLQAVGDELV